MAQQRGPVWTVVGGIATATTFYLLGRKTTPTTTTTTPPTPAQDEKLAFANVTVTTSSDTAYRGINDSKPATEMLPAARQHLRGDEPSDSSCAVTYEMDGVQYEWGCPKRERTRSYANTTISNDSAYATVENIIAPGEAATPFTDTTLGFFCILFFGVFGSIFGFCLLIVLTQYLGIALEKLAGYLVRAHEAFTDIMDYCIDYLRMFLDRRTQAEFTIVKLKEELQRRQAMVDYYWNLDATSQLELKNCRAEQAKLEAEQARLEAELASQQHLTKRNEEDCDREIGKRLTAEDELDATQQEFVLLKQLSVELRTGRDSALWEVHRLQVTNAELEEQLQVMKQVKTETDLSNEAMEAGKISREAKLAAAQELAITNANASIGTQTVDSMPIPITKTNASIGTQTVESTPIPVISDSVHTQAEEILKDTGLKHKMSATKQIEALTARYDEKLSEIEDKDEELEHLENDLKAEKEARETAEEAMKDVKTESDARGKALREARRARDNADKDAVHFTKECRKAQQDVSDLQQKLRDMEAVKKESDARGKALREARQARETAENEASQAQEDLSALQDELQNIEAEKKRLEDESAELKDEMERLTDEKEEFNDEYLKADSKKDKWKARQRKGVKQLRSFKVESQTSRCHYIKKL